MRNYVIPKLRDIMIAAQFPGNLILLFRNSVSWLKVQMLDLSVDNRQLFLIQLHQTIVVPQRPVQYIQTGVF